MVKRSRDVLDCNNCFLRSVPTDVTDGPPASINQDQASRLNGQRRALKKCFFQQP